MKKITDPQVVHISALEGQPSTFWKSVTGKFYRTKKEAEEDLGDNTLNPKKYEVKKVWLDKYGKTIAIIVIAAIAGAVLAYYTPTIIKHFKK